jgi:hypothetical protein
MKEYNQAFKDALQFVSKYIYLNRGTKSLQNDIAHISHWLDDNPETTRAELLIKLAEILRKFKKEVRY